MLPVRMLAASCDQRRDSYLDSLQRQPRWPIAAVAFAVCRRGLDWGR